jgi:hypothetical protein
LTVVNSSEVFGLAGKYIALPAFILCALAMARHIRSLQELRFLIIRTVLASLLFAWISTMTLWNLLLLYNMTGSGEKVVIAGKVSHLRESGVKYNPRTYTMSIDVKGKGLLDLGISAETYRSLCVGADYSSTWTRGRLGYLYRARSIILPSDIQIRADQVQIPDFGSFNRQKTDPEWQAKDPPNHPQVLHFAPPEQIRYNPKTRIR